MNDATIAIVCVAAIGVIVLLSEIAGRLLHVPDRITRLALHIFSGVLVAFAPAIFAERWWPVAVSLCLLFILLMSIYFGWLPSIHAARPASYGTVWFALSVSTLYLLAWNQPMLITIPLLVMAFGDAAGVIVGETRRRAIPLPPGLEGKSWDGSIAVFGVTGLTVSLGWEAFGMAGTGEALLAGLVCGLVAAVVEAVSRRGTDNITLPFSMVLILMILKDTSNQPYSLLMVEAAALVIAIASVRWKILRPDGAAGAFLIAVFLLGGGGWPWTIPLLVFFVFSSAISKISDHIRGRVSEIMAKGSKRDLGQVCANGGVPVLIFLSAFFGADIAFVWPAFLGAVATVTADTWGTEIGMASRKEARLITTRKVVPAGTSGGVTLPGFAGSAAGAAVIALAAFLLAPEGIEQMVTVTLAALCGGIAGSLFDSFLGATLQVQYRCLACGAFTENRRHCELSGVEPVTGLTLLDNDMVNVVSAVTGAITAVIVASIL